MSVNLKINNLSRLNIYQADSLKADVEVGATIVSVDNTNRYIPGTFVIMGKIGGDSSESAEIEGALGTDTVRLKSAALSFHHRGDSFTLLYGNAIKIYRASSVGSSAPDNADYVSIATVLIDYDEAQTKWTDADGSDDYWYKFTYYNTSTLQETSLSNSVGARGGGGNAYCTVDEIRHEAGFDDDSSVTDEDIDRKRQAAQARIDGMLAGKYQLPFPKPTSPQISDLTIRLAAGLVMISEYGVFDGQEKTKGEKKRDDALAELKDIQSGVSRITDLQAIDTTLPDAGGFSSSFGEQAAPRMFVTEDNTDPTARQY